MRLGILIRLREHLCSPPDCCLFWTIGQFAIMMVTKEHTKFFTKFGFAILFFITITPNTFVISKVLALMVGGDEVSHPFPPSHPALLTLMLHVQQVRFPQSPQRVLSPFLPSLHLDSHSENLLPQKRKQYILLFLELL